MIETDTRINPNNHQEIFNLNLIDKTLTSQLDAEALNIPKLEHEQEWYIKLVQDITKLKIGFFAQSRLEVIPVKWRLGRRILKDELKFGRAEYGNKTIQQLAEDCKISPSTLYHCIRFYKKYPKKEKLDEILYHGIKSWRDIRNSLWDSERKNDEIIPFNVFDFHKCDNNYGIETYPGKLSAQIVKNLLARYTNPGSKVLDIFSGGGVVQDVCIEMGRECKSYDIRPVRDFIIKNNVLDGVPEADESFDFIMIDPPYWNKKKGGYSSDKNDLSRLGLEKFYDAINFVARECWRVLKKNGKVVLIMDNIVKKDFFEDLGFKCNSIFLKQPFREVIRISALYSKHLYFPDQIDRAVHNKSFLNLFRDIIVYEKVDEKC